MGKRVLVLHNSVNLFPGFKYMSLNRLLTALSFHSNEENIIFWGLKPVSGPFIIL